MPSGMPSGEDAVEVVLPRGGAELYWDGFGLTVIGAPKTRGARRSPPDGAAYPPITSPPCPPPLVWPPQGANTIRTPGNPFLPPPEIRGFRPDPPSGSEERRGRHSDLGPNPVILGGVADPW